MMKSRAWTCATLVAAAVLLCDPGTAIGGVVYSNDFEGVVGSQWSHSTTSVTPRGARGFLGEFVNDTVRLTLNGLAPHAEATVSVELFILKTWDGNATGGDVWNLSVAGGQVLLNTTFSQHVNSFRQAYPDWYPGGDHPRRTGADEINTLGGYSHGDSVYYLSFTFPHTSNALEFAFSANGLEPDGNETWGLDNIVVSTIVPEPTTLTLATLGLISFAARWRRLR